MRMCVFCFFCKFHLQIAAPASSAPFPPTSSYEIVLNSFQVLAGYVRGSNSH
jgi:hypothetical protein